MRKGLEANDGRDIYDSSTTPLDHRSKDMLGQLHNRFNIHPYLKDHVIWRRRDKVSGSSYPGVVNQQFYFPQLVQTS